MDDRQFEQVCACTLGRLFGYSPRTSCELIGGFGSASAIFKASPEELEELLGPYSDIVAKLNRNELEISFRELEKLSGMGVSFLPQTDPAFPQLLRDCEDAPAGLYIRSESTPEEIFAPRPFVSVIGTRDLSLYGKEWCERIVLEMSRAPSRPTVVSGLAIGVDICAQMTALSCSLPTVAVLPTGIDDIYPKRHCCAASKIVSAPGSALVTDYPPGTAPLPVNFLRRNRIIAGLSGSTILVESRDKGGGMMTARLAAGYGRDVFALPGRVDDVRSGGCNRLLREKIAEPITGVDGLSEVLGLGVWKRGRSAEFSSEVRACYSKSLPDEQVELLVAVASLVKSRRGISIEEICAEIPVSYGDGAALAGMLETDGFIRIDLLQRCSVDVAGRFRL